MAIGDKRQSASLATLICGAGACFIGVVVIAGWVLRISILVQPTPGWAPMQFNTAVCVILCGTGLLFARAGRNMPASAIALILSVPPALSICEYVFGVDLGCDQALFRSWISAGVSYPGRIELNGAICLLLMSIGLVVVLRKPRPAGVFASFLATCVAAIGLAALVRWATGTDPAHRWGEATQMAVHTALTFMILATGLFTLRTAPVEGRPKHWFAALAAGLAAAFTILLWWGLMTERRVRLAESRDEEAATVVTHCAEMIRELTGILRRFDSPSVMNCAQPAPACEEDAAEVLRDWPAMVAIGRIEPDTGRAGIYRRSAGKPRGIVPITGADEAGQSWRTLAASLKPGEVRMEDASFEEGIAGVVLAVRAAESANSGVTLAWFRVPAFYESLLSPQVAAAAPVRIMIGEREVFRRPPYSPAAPTFGGGRSSAEFAQRGAARWETVRVIDLMGIDWKVIVGPSTLVFQTPSVADVELTVGLILSCLLGLTTYSGQIAHARSHSIAEEKKELEKLVESRAVSYRFLADSIPQIVWTADPDGTIDYINRYGLDMIGLPRKAVAANLWDDIVHPEDFGGTMAAWTAALRTGEPFEASYRLRGAIHGAYRWHLGRSLPQRDESGKIVKWFATAIDIDDSRRALKEISELNDNLENRVRERTADLERANQELEAFSYSVSHDLRSPLGVILGFTTIMLDQYGDAMDPMVKTYLGHVLNSAKRMDQLMQDLIQLGRLSRATLERAPVDMTALALSVLRELEAGDPDRNVQVRIQPGVQAKGDEGLLRTALENLINNAWKYTKRCSEPKIEFGTRADGNEPVLFVRDNGAGFDMAQHHKLFKPFQRLHTKDQFHGSGIGLATVQRILERHGGRIWAESEVGKGSTFLFTLPG